MRIILASQSPRRKKLMDLINLKYDVIVSNADESFEDGLNIKEQSKRLAYKKAKKVFDETDGDRIVIGSDTMVLKDERVYNKPKDKDDAIRMLHELNGNEHEVITSLSVIIEKNGKIIEYADYDIAEVHIKKMSDEEIMEWVENGKPLDKAGAYAIQSEFAVYVDRIVGNYFTIVGLPIHKLYDVIKEYIK